ncbi:hypothetical protein, partial [Methanogenium cariaci]|uniref:hypothetical protein n=1 Tax=Methanogenium cariaci TaxID=2197 RepID=UPI001C44F8A4
MATLLVLIVILVAPAMAMTDNNEYSPYYEDVIVIYSGKCGGLQSQFPLYSPLETPDIYFQGCIPASEIVVGDVSMINLTDADF